MGNNNYLWALSAGEEIPPGKVRGAPKLVPFHTAQRKKLFLRERARSPRESRAPRMTTLRVGCGDGGASRADAEPSERRGSGDRRVMRSAAAERENRERSN